MAAPSTIREDLWAYLNGKDAFADAVGRESDGGAVHLYPLVAPTDDGGNVELERYAVYTRISGTHDHHMLAAAGQARGISQFDLYAPTPEETTAMGEGLRASIDGMVNKNIGSGSTVSFARLVSEIDDWIGPKSASEDGTYLVRMDVEVFYTESVPTFA